MAKDITGRNKRLAHVAEPAMVIVDMDDATRTEILKLNETTLRVNLGRLWRRALWMWLWMRFPLVIEIVEASGRFVRRSSGEV